MGEMTTGIMQRLREDPDWMAHLPELTGDEIRLSLAGGWVVNLRDDDGDLLRADIPTDDAYSGAFLEAPLPTARIDLDTLALILRDCFGRGRSEGVAVDARGLHLRQLVVSCGTGDLNRVDLDVPLVFAGCVFDGPLTFEQAKLSELRFDTCAWIGESTYQASVQLGNAGVGGELGFFRCEGLRQLFAPGASIGSLSIRADAIELPEEGRAGFRTVLAGARIGELYADLSSDPHRVLPAGDCGGMRVDTVTVLSPAAVHDDASIAEWIARWLSGGVPPRASLPLGSWRAPAGIDHHPTAWRSIADALSRAGYESIPRLRQRDSPLWLPAYRDQGLELRLLANRHRDSALGFLSRLLRWLSLDFSVRYFTANTRALVGLALVWLAVSSLAWCHIHELWRGSDVDGTPLVAPENGLAAGADGVLWAGTYGLDFVVSPLELGFDAVWPTSVGLLAVFALLKLVALTLFGLFIVGVSGVVSRSR